MILLDTHSISHGAAELAYVGFRPRHFLTVNSFKIKFKSLTVVYHHPYIIKNIFQPSHEIDCRNIIRSAAHAKTQYRLQLYCTPTGISLRTYFREYIFTSNYRDRILIFIFLSIIYYFPTVTMCILIAGGQSC